MDNEAKEATYSLMCLPNQYTVKKVHLALCILSNFITCVTNLDSILVLIYTIASPPSSYVCYSKEKINASLFNCFSTTFCIDVILPIYKIELYNTVCRIKLFPLNDKSLLLYRFVHFKFRSDFPPSVIIDRKLFENHWSIFGHPVLLNTHAHLPATSRSCYPC